MTDENIEEVLEIVETYGEYGMDVNESFRYQIILANEIKRLRALHFSPPSPPPAGVVVQSEVEEMLGAFAADALQEDFDGVKEWARAVKIEFRDGAPIVRLAAAPSAPEQEPVALTVWAGKYQASVRWLKSVPIGTPLYAAPQPEQAQSRIRP